MKAENRQILHQKLAARPKIVLLSLISRGNNFWLLLMTQNLGN